MGGTRRLTLREAAKELSVSAEAVRKRVKRGSLRSDKDPDGRVYVYLDAAGDGGESKPEVETSELVRTLREQIGYLRDQLDREREARTEESRRHDTIVAQLMQRIPELEAPESREEAAESPETVEEGLGRSRGVDTSSSNQGAPGAHRVAAPRPDTRPLWRHLLLVLWWVGWMTIYGLSHEYLPLSISGLGGYGDVLLQFLLFLVGPLCSGYWIGYQKRTAIGWRDYLPVGLIASTLSAVVISVLFAAYALSEDIPDTRFIIETFVFNTRAVLPIQLGSLVIYTFAAIWANGRRRRRVSVASGNASSPPAEESGHNTQDWTARQRELIGLCGLLGSAIISGIAGIVAAVI